MTTLQFSMIYNIGSIALGISAWVLAGLAIASKEKNILHRFSLSSLGVCMTSLLLQFFEISNRVNNGDFSAIEDTIGAVIFASVILVVITIALNVWALCKRKG